MRGVEGQSFIVTGGSAGIGAACAARLLADGAMVTICGRSERRLHDAAEQLARGDSSVRARLHFEVADVTVEDDVARLVAQAVAQHGSLHGFVANAGGGGTLEEAAEFLLTIGPGARAIAEQNLDHAEARRRVVEQLSPHGAQDAKLPAACWIVSATA